MDWPRDRRKAFLWVAEAFGTPRDERTEKQRDLTICGICFAIYKLTDSFVGSDWMIDMGRKMGIETAYWWPCRGTRDEERSLFCCLMASLSYEEFKLITFKEEQDGQ